jgi:hypothetical protein
MSHSFGGRIRGRAALALALGGPLAACVTSVGAWTYPSGRYPTTECERPAPVVVAVERFSDRRDETNRSWMPWAYVPFAPGGWTHFDRPEAVVPGTDTTQYRTLPTDDLARSVAAELEREKMVARAEYVGDGHVDASATHVLRGKMRTYYVHESRWTYGLSIYAQIFWCLGFPMGTSRNGFCVDLELVELRDQRVVWQGTVYDADFHVEGFYYGPEWYRFSWMWERRLRSKMGEIASALGAPAAPLPKRLDDELRAAAPQLPTCLGIDSNFPCRAK